VTFGVALCIHQIRCVALVDDVYIVFDYLFSDKPHVYDRYQHGRGGKAAFTPKTTPLSGVVSNLPKESNFTNIQNTQKTRKLDVLFKNNLKMRLVADKNFTGYKVVGVSGYQALPAEIAFARAENVKQISFLAGFTFGKNSKLPELKIVKADEKGFLLDIKTSSGKYTLKGNLAKKTVIVKAAAN
jgi:hypothetical protein